MVDPKGELAKSAVETVRYWYQALENTGLSPNSQNYTISDEVSATL